MFRDTVSPLIFTTTTVLRLLRIRPISLLLLLLLLLHHHHHPLIIVRPLNVGTGLFLPRNISYGLSSHQLLIPTTTFFFLLLLRSVC
jgi:hypothetical protein